MDFSFKNASLTRERIRNTSADSNWHVFNDLLNNTPRGNFGNFGLYYDAQEILPAIQGEYRYNKDGERITRYKSKEVEVRALVEGQFVAKKAYVEDFGLVTGPNTRIIATGGASMNKNILQVIADVFNSPVYVSVRNFMYFIKVKLFNACLSFFVCFFFFYLVNYQVAIKHLSYSFSRNLESLFLLVSS